MPHDNLNMNSSNCFSYTTINQRDNNEDYQSVFLLPYAEDTPPITVLVVADGMGGHEHGEDVSRQAVLKIREFLNQSVDRISRSSRLRPEDLKQLLLKAIESTHELVLRMVQVNGWKQAGSTIVVAAIWGDRVIAANLGDSPLFHYGARRAKAVRVTQDHSVPGILAQANLISEEMARYHERRGQLEFFLGAAALPPTEPLYERKLEPGDLLLLCSDGVSGLLRLEQIEAILARPETSLKEKANELIQTSRELGETDNQTLILWQFSRAGSRSISHTSQASLSRSTGYSEQPYSEQPHPEKPTATLIDAQTVHQGSQTVIQSSCDSTSLPPTSSVSRTLRVTRPARSKPSLWKAGLRSLLVCLAIFAIAYLTLFPLRDFMLSFSATAGRSTPTAPQPQQPQLQTTPAMPQLEQPQPEQPQQLPLQTTPEMPVASASPPTNEAGIGIERFVEGGSILITKGLDGTLAKWRVVATKGNVNCTLAVAKELENQQRIVAVTPRHGLPKPKRLLTLGEDGCIRQWTDLQVSWQGIPDLLQSVLQSI